MRCVSRGVLAAGIWLLTSGLAVAQEESSELEVGDAAPAFEILAEDGASIALDKLRDDNGHVVLVFVRAHW